MRLALTFKYIPLLIIALISVSGCSSSSTSPADDLAEAPDLVSEDPIDELIESTGSDNTAETSSNESSSEPLGNPAAEEPEQVQDTVAVAEVQNEIPEPEITPVDSGSEEMAVTADSPAVQTLPQVDFLLDEYSVLGTEYFLLLLSTRFDVALSSTYEVIRAKLSRFGASHG